MTDGIGILLGAGKKRLVLELTYHCNSACTSCSAYSTDDNEMPFEIAVPAIDQAAVHGFSAALFTGGEPTLVDALPELVSYAHDQGLSTRVNTNGSADSPMYWNILKNNGLDTACVSVDLSHNSALNTHPIPLNTALRTIDSVLESGANLIVNATPLRSCVDREADYLCQVHRHLNKYAEPKNLAPNIWVFAMDRSVAYLEISSFLYYNGRTGKAIGAPPQKTKCPYAVDLVDSYMVRVSPSGELRVPCGSEQRLRIPATSFNPTDPESLVRPIEHLRDNTPFRSFLAQGSANVGDLCGHCIDTYLRAQG